MAIHQRWPAAGKSHELIFQKEGSNEQAMVDYNLSHFRAGRPTLPYY